MADNLAYVIYTSGSTGKPKGVSIPHRAVTRLVRDTNYVKIEPFDRVAQASNCTFDAATFEIWGSLLNGARLVGISRDVALSSKEFAAQSREHEISILFLTTALFNQLVREVPWAFHSMRHLLFGGEAVDPRWVKAVLQHGPPKRLLHVYGPTESTTFASWHLVEEIPEGATTVPIGRAVANTYLYILDRHLSPVPIGVTAELYIGGDGLARGYLNRPELTGEKFIPDPFGKDPGARLYKTGDLVRYRADGSIEFLGRTDHQVKIRGYRVELPEIEAVLGRHSGVRETVVVTREQTSGDKQLVAYVVASQVQAPGIGELRNFLKAKLPDYMVPSAFVFLDSLPLTPNGKVDRGALPAADQSRPQLEESFVAPRTPVEELLAGIWADVLKVERVGVYDDFFKLGGHSLLATQVISRLRSSLQVELPLQILFERRTVVDFAMSIEKARRSHSGVGVNAPTIVPVLRQKESPLSFAQQRLWFLDQLEPGSTVYNVAGAVRLREMLDVAALEQSIHEIIGRHESLRTTFAMLEGEPVQIIAPSLSVPLLVVDLTDHPESEREDEARRLAGEEARRPFDLAQGPLFRATLIRLGHEDHVLLLTMHHIVSDGWSMGVLYRELSVLYRAFTNAQPSPLSDLPIQYADFAVWQRKWLQGEVLEAQLSYWKKQLERAPGVLNLPTDRPRPAVQSFRGARQSLELSKELTEELKALSRKEGVTLFMTLLAAFQTLLYRYTAQDDIVVGSPIANRNRTEIEGLIGFFVNTLVLRTNLGGNPTFHELLGRVREVALGAYAHQDLPFEKLVEELHPERSLNHTPLFQVLFNMVNQEDSKPDLLGLTTERFSSSDAESKFDLTLYAREEKEEIHFTLVYNTDLFSQAWMTCFSQQYRYLLEQIVAAPQKPIRSYSLVTSESRLLLPDPTAVLAEPSQQLVTSTFSSWAKQTPKHPAISQGEQTWTYDELAERADALAQVLVASGLERGDVVGVYGPPSFGVIAAMIGTLLSGGVLLPIDHTLPGPRKQLMLREAKARWLLYIDNKDSDQEWLQKDEVAGILCVDPAAGCALVAQAQRNLQAVSLPEILPEDAAYIFFTSGTTGTPNGVLGCHKSLSHFLTWQRDTFSVGPHDRVAQLTSLSFDVVLRDVFLPLMSGATLCLPEASDPLGPDQVIGWLERERISILHTVPALAQSWLAHVPSGVRLRAMRWVFFAGEPLTDTLVRRWREAFPSCGEFVNLYGPTETTLAKCYYRVPADMPTGIQPVGRPLPETQALVLTESNQLCGINELGEIVLRTPFRSLGYINAPGENQKKFRKNPSRNDDHDLLYFTGDGGRYRPDGTLTILARLDDQVKIRGVRVEPDEVMTTLAQHPAVESCFVAAKKKENDEVYLVAYVAAAAPAEATTGKLRSYLAGQLPAAMIPRAFVFLDELPFTTNGKVSRSALPAPDLSSPEPQDRFVAPRTLAEQTLATIWAKVLKLEQVGIYDNFFDVGGHSLLATQVISRVRDIFQIALSLRSLFEAPTIAGLAERIETILWAAKQFKASSEVISGDHEEIEL